MVKIVEKVESVEKIGTSLKAKGGRRRFAPLGVRLKECWD